MNSYRGVRVAVLALATAALVAGVSGSVRAATPAPKRAPSLPPPPTRVDVTVMCGIGTSCVKDVWGSEFTVTVSPHVLRVGQVMTVSVSDSKGWQWAFTQPPLAAKMLGCHPKPGVWINAPSSGRCTYRMTGSTAGWATVGAAVNPLGQSYEETDYYTVLRQGYLLHGTVRDAEGRGIRNARIDFAGPGDPLYTTTDAAGSYNAILTKGIYTVSVETGKKVCATHLSGCESSIKVNMVSDKQVDFAAQSLQVVGSVLDNRGKPLAGVTVAAGKFGEKTAKDGSYALTLDPGSYSVHVVPLGKTDRERYEPAAKLVKGAHGKVTADFKLVAADEVSITTEPQATTTLEPGFQLYQGLYWTIAPPNGVWRVPVTVTVENGRGDPVPDLSLTVREPTWLVAPKSPESGPRAIVCDDTWRRLDAGAKRFTDASGTIKLNVLTGTDVGSFGLVVAETDNAGFFDLGRFGQLGRIGGSDPKEILIGKVPGTQKTLADAQKAWLNYLLAARYKAGTRGFAAGDFGPIRSADRKAGAIVFYPEHDPGPLRDYFAGTSTAALWPRYHAMVLPITYDLSVTGWVAQRADLQTLAAWEKQHGKPQAGYVAPHANESLAYFGYPYPPPTDNKEFKADLVIYNHCVPGAAP